MATFTLNWDNTLVLAEPNAINQRVSYRVKTVGGAFLTTGFTPTNDLITTDVTASMTGDPNKIYEFKVEALCTSGGPTANDNGVVEQIVFECINPTSLIATQTTVTVTIDLSATDVTKVKYSLRKQGDDSLVATSTVICPGVGTTDHTFTGLTGNTAYYVTAEFYCTINGIEVISSDANYLNAVCGGNIEDWQVTTDAVLLANLIFSWNKSAGESVNLTTRINGSYSSVDWGDGNINLSLSHTYIGAGNYTVRVYGSTASFVEIDSIGPTSTFKVTAFTAVPATVSGKLGLDTNTIPSLPSLAPNTSLLGLSVSNNSLTAFPDLSNNLILEQLYLKNNNIAGSYDFSLNTALIYVEIDDNNITGVSGFDNTLSLGTLLIGNNSISVSDINNALVALDNNGITNGFFVSSGQTPAAVPTGLGATAAASLVLKGWTVVTD